ncbi:MbnP family protein [Chryseobacterium culicis]|uniref:Copper-binding protein MbnP-like domain-containing protein n=2 Tax=Chryseobacterium culicis TaxID=680127 RepID=A0ABX5CFT6_CHRCI|nr:MbnP family protein [Chryseobacterium culicis]PRB90518.1 hypothetical protein CQ033_07235 [Chryseobacterium culicis]
MKKLLYLFSMLLLSSHVYSATRDSLKIKFNPLLNGEKITDNAKHHSKDKTLMVKTFKFYVSNFIINYEDSSSEIIDKVFLYDITKKESGMVQLPKSSIKKVKSVLFTIGLDSLTTKNSNMENELDPIHGMFWSWRTGYINYKIEGSYGSSKNKQPFVYHIGGNAPEYDTTFRVKKIDQGTALLTVDIELKSILEFLNQSRKKTIMSINNDSLYFSQFFKKCFQ